MAHRSEHELPERIRGGQQRHVHDDGLWRRSFCLCQPLDVEPKHRKGNPEADHDDEQTREKDEQAPANHVVSFWPLLDTANLTLGEPPLFARAEVGAGAMNLNLHRNVPPAIKNGSSRVPPRVD